MLKAKGPLWTGLARGALLCWLVSVPVTLLAAFDPPDAPGISEDDGSALLPTADLDDKILSPLPSPASGVHLLAGGVASGQRDREAPSVSILAPASRSPPRR